MTWTRNSVLTEQQKNNNCPFLNSPSLASFLMPSVSHPPRRRLKCALLFPCVPRGLSLTMEKAKAGSFSLPKDMKTTSLCFCLKSLRSLRPLPCKGYKNILVITAEALRKNSQFLRVCVWVSECELHCVTHLIKKEEEQRERERERTRLVAGHKDEKEIKGDFSDFSEQKSGGDLKPIKVQQLSFGKYRNM